MYKNFEGDYRRRPQQNLAGASRKDGRHELLTKAQEERRRRQEMRERQHCAKIIQRFYRSYLVRKYVKDRIKMAYFDIMVACHKKKNVDIDDIHDGLRHLLFFYNPMEDGGCIIWISNAVIEHHQIVFHRLVNRDWHWLIIRLINMHVLLLRNCAAKHKALENKGLITNIFNKYCCIDTLSPVLGKESAINFVSELFVYVLNRDYYDILRTLFDVVPSTPGERIFITETLFQMVMKPIELMRLNTTKSFHELVMKTFGESFLFTRITPSIRKLVLPELLNYNSFPLEELIVVYHKTHFQSVSSSLYMFMSLDKNMTEINECILQIYIELLAKLSPNLIKVAKVSNSSDVDVSSESDEDRRIFINPSALDPVNLIHLTEMKVLDECVKMFSHQLRIAVLLEYVSKNLHHSVFDHFLKLVHNVMLCHNDTHGFLSQICRYPTIIKAMWLRLLSLERRPQFSGQQSVYFLNLISHGIVLTESEAELIVPYLTVFSAAFGEYLITLTDDEFYSCSDIEKCAIPFNMTEIITMGRKLRDVALGLVEAAYPETHYKNYRPKLYRDYVSDPAYNAIVWTRLFKEVMKLIRYLYVFDVRRGYSDEDYWVSSTVHLPDRIPMSTSHLLSSHNYPAFQSAPPVTRSDSEEGTRLTVSDLRLIMIMKEMPFVVSFFQRVSMIQFLIGQDKVQYQNPALHFLHVPSVFINVRRDYIYEDSIESLSTSNVPEIRIAIRVHLISKVGVEEAGVDGGGVFREFLSELLKTAFDPNRGFFCTTLDNQLYPNPYVYVLHPYFMKHYFFIGRMLGKAIYENLLVELPLAEFFLAKILGDENSCNFNNLASLDPEMYRNLSSLKTYDGDFDDLGLDFSMVIDEYGKPTVIELKPNGRECPVTKNNREEYISLVANHKLNKQIQNQCEAVKTGLCTVIPIEWLHMFNSKEFQVIISGTENPVDIKDMRKHTIYTGGFTNDHFNIERFWRVVGSFDTLQKSLLLKFVTSCSRPPLFGFKDLDPPFGIQLVEGSGERLPTSSTCMNLLKLPIFKDDETMKEKLLYAIQSGAGFELS